MFSVANGNTSASFKINHNGSTILSSTTSFDSKISGNTVYDESEDIEPSLDELKNVYISVNVLDKVQLKGKISDVLTAMYYINESENSYTNESAFKSYVNQLNGLLDIKIFYDNGSTPQAKVELESFSDRYGSTSYWYFEPVLKFDDGTSYSTFEAFFNENDFKALIRAAQDLLDSYEKELDKFDL